MFDPNNCNRNRWFIVWLSVLALFAMFTGCSQPDPVKDESSIEKPTTQEGVVIKDGGVETDQEDPKEFEPECVSNDDCKDPSKPWCLNGNCSTHRPCFSDDDCTDPEKPKCLNGTCDAIPPECIADSDCLNPARPLCKSGRCEAAPPECQSDADCADPSKPMCINGRCQEKPDACSSDADCRDPAKPICINGVCESVVTCQSDADCKDPNMPICRNGRCEPLGNECFQNSDCLEPTKPRCLNNQCVPPECLTDAHCNKDPGRPKCLEFNCVAECAKDQDCSADQICLGGKCAPKPGCQSDADCVDPNRPLCINGKCEPGAGCQSDADCKNPNLPKCFNGQCAPKDVCGSDQDCPDPTKPLCLNGICSAPPPECVDNSDCRDPIKPVCNNGKCEAAPPECKTDADCKEADKPLCIQGKCAPKTGCRSDTDCKDAVLKHCELSSGQCFACVVDAHCQTWQLCDIRTHTCVTKPGSCANNADCRDPGLPFCVNNSCVACAKDADCKPLQACQKNQCVHVGCSGDKDCTPKFCNTKTKECVECLEDKNCKVGQVCDPQTLTCKTFTCASDGDCKAPTPACHVASGKCVECVDVKHCPQGFKCVNNLCVNCAADTDCTTRNPSPPYGGNSTHICENNKCQAGCRLDTNCALGYICCNKEEDSCFKDPLKKYTCFQGCRSNRDCPTGRVCSNGECIITCTSNANCNQDPTKRVCDTNTSPAQCVQCLTNTDCTTRYGGTFAQQRPVCNTTTKTCGCTRNADCPIATNAAQGVCDIKNNICIGCATDNDCRRGYICNNSNQCVSGCRANSDCTTGKVCNIQTTQCVDCVQNSDCKVGVCDRFNRCVECLQDSDCKDPKMPNCDTTSLTCFATGNKVQCQSCAVDKDCAQGYRCTTVQISQNVTERVCAKECNNARDCDEGFSCGSTLRPTLRNRCWPNYQQSNNTWNTCRALVDQGKTCKNDADCGYSSVQDANCSTLQSNICIVLCSLFGSNQCIDGYKCGCPPGYTITADRCRINNGVTFTSARCIK